MLDQLAGRITAAQAGLDRARDRVSREAEHRRITAAVGAAETAFTAFSAAAENLIASLHDVNAGADASAQFLRHVLFELQPQIRSPLAEASAHAAALLDGRDRVRAWPPAPELKAEVSALPAIARTSVLSLHPLSWSEHDGLKSVGRHIIVELPAEHARRALAADVAALAGSERAERLQAAFGAEWIALQPHQCWNLDFDPPLPPPDDAHAAQAA